VKCSACSKEAVMFAPYSGRHLCRSHFYQFVEKRVKKEMRSQFDLKGCRKIAVGVSGGKDSLLALYFIHKFLDPTPIEIEAITIDEGIQGYRSESILFALRLSKRLGVEHHVVSFKDQFGYDLDEVVTMDRSIGACSYCGVLRRKLLNYTSKLISADYLATGLNLDDTAQSILMNFTKGDVEKLARLGPHSKVQPGLVPRIQPLRMIPERETYLYTLLKKIPFHDGLCPYAVEAVRGEYRDIINKLEDAHPGTRHAIVSSYETIKEPLSGVFPPASLEECTMCGDPTAKTLCKSCEFLNEMEKKLGERK